MLSQTLFTLLYFVSLPLFSHCLCPLNFTLSLCSTWQLSGSSCVSVCLCAILVCLSFCASLRKAGWDIDYPFFFHIFCSFRFGFLVLVCFIWVHLFIPSHKSSAFPFLSSFFFYQRNHSLQPVVCLVDMLLLPLLSLLVDVRIVGISLSLSLWVSAPSPFSMYSIRLCHFDCQISPLNMTHNCMCVTFVHVGLNNIVFGAKISSEFLIRTESWQYIDINLFI